MGPGPKDRTAIVGATVAAEIAIFSGSYGPNPCGAATGLGAIGCNVTYEVHRDQYERARTAGGVLVGAAGVGLVVLYALSARQGFGDAARCDELQDWRSRALLDR